MIEGILHAASDGYGTSPLAWVAGPLRDAGRVLDLCCGRGPLAVELGAERWLGVDPEPGPHSPRVRAVPTALPLRTNSIDGVAILLALPHLAALDAVFAEVRRVLRPAGTLVVLVPSGSVRSIVELRYARLLAPVRTSGWTNRSALDRAGWLLHAADFAVLADERVPFVVPLPGADAAAQLVDELPRAGLWPSDLAADVLATLRRGLMERAGPGRVLPVPMRRLVARR